MRGTHGSGKRIRSDQAKKTVLPSLCATLPATLTGTRKTQQQHAWARVFMTLCRLLASLLLPNASDRSLFLPPLLLSFLLPNRKQGAHSSFLTPTPSFASLLPYPVTQEWASLSDPRHRRWASSSPRTRRVAGTFGKGEGGKARTLVMRAGLWACRHAWAWLEGCVAWGLRDEICSSGNDL